MQFLHQGQNKSRRSMTTLWPPLMRVKSSAFRLLMKKRYAAKGLPLRDELIVHMGYGCDSNTMRLTISLRYVSPKSWLGMIVNQSAQLDAQRKARNTLNKDASGLPRFVGRRALAAPKCQCTKHHGSHLPARPPGAGPKLAASAKNGIACHEKRPHRLRDLTGQAAKNASTPGGLARTAPARYSY